MSWFSSRAFVSRAFARRACAALCGAMAGILLVALPAPSLAQSAEVPAVAQPVVPERDVEYALRGARSNIPARLRRLGAERAEFRDVRGYFVQSFPGAPFYIVLCGEVRQIMRSGETSAWYPLTYVGEGGSMTMTDPRNAEHFCAGKTFDPRDFTPALSAALTDSWL